ncbi:hypothetical protein M8J77_024179 [Diaphorina citri]|nr:hypothetical protein M8J77_024179 [Diaphorina citri]
MSQSVSCCSPLVLACGLADSQQPMAHHVDGPGCTRVLSAPDDIGTSSAAPAPRPPPSNESTTDSSTQPTRPTAAAAAVPGLDSLDLTSPLSRPGSMSPAAPQSMEAGTYSYPNLTSPLSRPGSMSPAAPSLWKQVRTPILT